MRVNRYQKEKAQNKIWREKHPLQWAFICQRQNARRRGIEFLFTFSDWLRTWGEAIELRGRGADALCMSRINDTGPYAEGNVEIITNRGNNRLQHRAA